MANDDIAAIRQVDLARLRAMADRDGPGLAALLTEDFTYTHTNGLIDDRASLLERLASGAVAWEDPEVLRADVRLYGDIAVVNGHFRLTVRHGGTARRLNSLSLAVWRRGPAGWRLAATASTPLPEA